MFILALKHERVRTKTHVRDQTHTSIYDYLSLLYIKNNHLEHYATLHLIIQYYFFTWVYKFTVKGQVKAKVKVKFRFLFPYR